MPRSGVPVGGDPFGALGISGVLYDDNYKARWRGQRMTWNRSEKLEILNELGGGKHVRCKSKCTHH